MKMFRLNVLFAVLMALGVMSGCSKDDDENKGGPEGYVKPEIAEQQQIVKVPAAIQNSSDPNLATVNGMLTSINGYSTYMQVMANIPGNAELVETKSTVKTWKWSVENINYWIEFTENIESYKWVLYIQETQMFTVKTKIIEATQSIVGTSGVMKIYFGYADPLVTYTWTKDGDDVFAQILYSYQGDYILYDVAVYADGSGSFDVYESQAVSAAYRFMHCEWNTAGKGSWWVKNLDSGETHGPITF